MDHNEAIRLQAAEKYVLGELPRELRDAYEEHYFDCAQCAIDVKAAAAFVDAGRDILRAQRQDAPATGKAARTAKASSGWFFWLRPAFAVPAFAVLLLALGYQSFVSVPHWKQAAMQAAVPRVLPMYSLIAANTRGAESQALQVREGEPFGLYVDVPADPVYTKYALRLADPDGNTALLRTVSYAEAQKTAVVEVTPGKRAGPYQIVVLGLTENTADLSKATTLATLKFNIEFIK